MTTSVQYSFLIASLLLSSSTLPFGSTQSTHYSSGSHSGTFNMQLCYIIKKSFEVCVILLPIDGSEDEKIHCFQKEGPLSNGREEFTERATAFYLALGQGAPVDENNPFMDLELDIFEEQHNEIVVHED